MTTYISTNTTTYVHTVQGFIKSFTVGNTVASTITIYDGSVSTDVADANIIGVLEASVVPNQYFSGVNFAKGLIVVTAGASDITVETQSASS